MYEYQMSKIKIPKLPRIKKPDENHRFLLRVPFKLWARMINEAKLNSGEVTKFIIEAVKEKLDRQTRSN